MFGKNITLDPANPNIPLPHLYSGQGSRAYIQISGYPAGTTPLFIFTEPDADEATVIEADASGAIYINGWSLDFADQVRYEIVCRDEDNISTSMGKGYLTIYASATSATIPTPPPIVPPETYVRNPVTGLYHLVTAVLNDANEIALNVSETGTETPNA